MTNLQTVARMEAVRPEIRGGDMGRGSYLGFSLRFIRATALDSGSRGPPRTGMTMQW
ncbi:hypothetical protein HNQ50_002987 [Silvimonas terrae]|uniref:Uncharacterized protein n=1 Tax=Silvimonas terrae TaxID=300266 RepID=A0A840RIV5_9NEIS|nr:hypothetical protein [Silvimonas terrae]